MTELANTNKEDLTKFNEVVQNLPSNKKESLEKDKHIAPMAINNNIPENKSKEENQKKEEKLNDSNKENIRMDIMVTPENNKEISNELTEDQRKKRIQKFYLSLQVSLTLHLYGIENFHSTKEKEESYKIPEGFLDRHQCSPTTREKMVDWMIEVFSVFECDEGCLELSIHILDLFLSKTQKKIYDKDIHLIGLTCMFISSKYEEIIPLQIGHIAKLIGHNSFKESEIREKEREILNTIDFDISFPSGTRDILLNIFYDFQVTNTIEINKRGLLNFSNRLKEMSIFLSQLTLYCYDFASYKQSVLAVSIIVLAFDFMKNEISKENQDFINDWIVFVISAFNYNSKTVKSVYEKIYNVYKILVKEPLENFKKKNVNGNLNIVDENGIISLCKYSKFQFQ